MAPSELRAEWAAQRIRGLSFAAAARTALFGGREGEVRSLIERFHYPRLGPGQMWEAMSERIEASGGGVTPRPRSSLSGPSTAASSRSRPMDGGSRPPT